MPSLTARAAKASLFRALGSARVSRVGERVLAIANFPSQFVTCPGSDVQKKDRFGATPEPARETRALLRVRGTLHLHDLGFFVLEMVVDGFDEAVREFLHFTFHVA